MVLVVAVVVILFGVILWRLVRLEVQSREQREVIEELHRRVWQLEDLVALLHRDRESHSD